MSQAASASTPASSPAHVRSRWHLSNAMFGFLIVLPALIVLAVFFVYPVLYSSYMSLHFFDLAKPKQFRFVGLENYITVLQNEEFHRALINTFVYAGIAVPLEFVFGMVLALALANIRVGRGLLRTTLVIPMMLAPVAMGLMWKFMYNNEFGIINHTLRAIGISSPPLWLADPNLALFSVVIVDIWATTPLIVLLMLAGLLSIPGEYYEAATIDGAGMWASFRRITLPLLQPVILVALLIRGMDAFRVFDVVYVMTKGGPAMRSDVLSYFAYRQAFTHRQIGEATATAWIMTFILLAGGYLLIRAMRRQEGSL